MEVVEVPISIFYGFNISCSNHNPNNTKKKKNVEKTSVKRVKEAGCYKKNSTSFLQPPR